jgi:hypothetical protein
MAQPQWITDAGSLGTVPEGAFYRVSIQAVAGIDDVFYTLISGSLPLGVQLTSSGTIEGTPRNIINIQGVPTQVNEDVTSRFAIRAYTRKLVNGSYVVDRLADRTFTLTIVGQDIPRFVTPAGTVATFYDGTEGSVQIQFTDDDIADNIKIKVLTGSLPPGMVLNPTTGLISGLIAPLVGPPGTATAGYDNALFDQYSFDFSTRSTSKNYQFTLEISDGKDSDLRTFEIYIYAKNSMSADTTDFTADNTFITADVSPNRIPVLLNPAGSIGRVRSDNFYAYKFDAVDFDGDQITYTIPGGIDPELNLTLNPTTGWLYGYLPDFGATENTYDFQVRAYKTIQPSIISDPRDFSLTVIGNVETEVLWLTNSNLGIIPNGSISTLNIQAVNTGGRALQYQLLSGSNSRLPQGLTLMPSGNIIGRVSFNTFALDGGTTTFDINLNDRLGIDQTTFDLSFTFTVNAFSSDSSVSVYRTFTVTVARDFNEPYETLYVKCMPPVQDRAIISQLVENQDIIPQDLVYRADDGNFGVASSVRYNHAYGLTAASLDLYVQSLDINHYWKNVTLGKIYTAQALDASGAVLYEVIYSIIVDDLVNNQGESVDKSVTLPYPVTLTDSVEISTVYPNSLINMREQVIDTVGQISPALPLWMTSKQTDGRVLGFTPAWVIAYVKPGASGKVSYNISTQFGNKLNIIDYKIDRYEIDRSQTHNWITYNDSTDAGTWVPYPPLATTFDIENYYNLSSFVGGSGYEAEDQILILGTQVGGVVTTNNVTITVAQVNVAGAIVSAFCSGNAPPLMIGDTYTLIAGTNITGTGVGATWNLVITGDDPTIFDGGSTTFIAPADRWTSTGEFDKYIVFPKTNILG